MAFIETTALRKIAELRKRIRFVNGGTSSSKTVSILMWLIDYAQTHQNEVISVVGESVPFLKRGVIRDFLSIMQQHHYFKDALWNRTDYIYTFETGSIIEFFSADNPGKVRGPRRHVLYLNEGNNISYDVYTQLEVRTRKIIFVDSNPTHEYWMYTEVMPHSDVDFITLTYHDNEALDQSIIDSIEARRGNKNWYKVYALGELGETEAQIYTGWQIIDSVPFEARLERRGLDFGYTNDPTALVDVYRYNNGLILDEQLYRKGMLNKPIADFIQNLSQPITLVVADSAEPKSIEEIRQHGVNILPSDKGQGSVSRGIAYVQDQRISMTKRSVNLIKEYRNYLWKTDRDGRMLNVPEDINNHCMDALRYAIESLKAPTQARVMVPTNVRRAWERNRQT